MGIRALSEELEGVLGGSEKLSPCCGDLRSILRELADAAGLHEDALEEAVKCNQDCRSKYLNEDGKFRGGKGEAFENCQKMFRECCKGVKDPAALCAYIGKRAGKI